MLPVDQRTADHQKAKEQTVLFVPRRGRFKIEDSNTAKCLQSILGEVLHDELTVPARNLISEGPVLLGVLHKSLPALLWNRLKHSETTNPCCPNSTWSEPINTYLFPYLFFSIPVLYVFYDLFYSSSLASTASDFPIWAPSTLSGPVDNRQAGKSTRNMDLLVGKIIDKNMFPM